VFDAMIPVLGLALLDSLNPSALAITLYLLTTKGPVPKVGSYLAGIFSTYLAAGVLLMLGLGTALAALGKAAEHPVVYGAQGVLGAGLLIYTIWDPNKGKPQGTALVPKSLGLGALFLLGITITAVEFSTALPYLGAIGLLTNADLAVGQWLTVLIVYNAIFILPPLLLLLASCLFGERLQSRFEQLRDKLQRGSREAWLWVLGLVGFLLLADSLRYFKSFNLMGG
jgi:cytochrome c biogenesis protein CcdA